MRALIVDDEAPARAKLRRWLKEIDTIEVIAEAVNGFEAVQAIADHAPDFVLLDIQMPGPNGLEVVAQLESSTAPLIVFVTAHDQHALAAFDLNAVDYLLKPYDKDRLLRTINRVRKRLGNRDSARQAVELARQYPAKSDRLLVPDGESLRFIDIADVLWLEADDNYVRIHADARSYLLRRTLQDLLEQLGPERFTRIHKSTGVNISAIEALFPLFKGDYEVLLRDGRRLRMSRRYRDALLQHTTT